MPSFRRDCVPSVGFAVVIACTRIARADHRPTTATDGFYVGARLEPGGALLGGWDLDVYVFRNRTLSVGPGVSLAVLSSQTNAPGQQQSLLFTADLLRLKIAPAIAGDYRPFLAIGGGFSYARLSEQTVSVSVLQADGTTAATTLRYAAAEEFAPIVTLGGGLDWFVGGPIAASVQLLAHYHPVGSVRVPDVWLDLAIGIRFGL